MPEMLRAASIRRRFPPHASCARGTLCQLSPRRSSSQRPVFNRAGDPSRYAWHAIRQIVDWRRGLVIVGRRGPLDDKRRAFRRGLATQLNIEIPTYDRLVERVEGRVASLQDPRRRPNG